VEEAEDLNPMRLKTIQHFFEHYKDLEPASGSRCWAGKARKRAQEEVVGMAASPGHARPEAAQA
jgi:inorganic pyrophosphatase